jgi:hypothetical protein
MQGCKRMTCLAVAVLDARNELLEEVARLVLAEAPGLHLCQQPSQAKPLPECSLIWLPGSAGEAPHGRPGLMLKAQPKRSENGVMRADRAHRGMHNL